MKLTIFGASGKTGKHVVEQALAAGHDVTAFVRNPAKLGITHERLSIVQGDATNAVSVEAAVRGADVVISVLGPTPKQTGDVVNQATRNIITGMKKQGVQRLIVSAGAGIGDANDQPTLMNRVISQIIKLTSKTAYTDMMQTAQTVRSSGLNWTIVRVPMLTDDPKTGKVGVGLVNKDMGFRISRADMADYMLRQITDMGHVRRAPAIWNVT